MGLGYGKYLEEGTRALMEMAASPHVDREERRFITNAFTDELMKQVGGMKDDADYERVLNTASVRYIDEKLTEGMSTPNLNNDDCEKLLNYCRRQRELLKMFQEKKWNVRDLKFDSGMLESCEEFFTRTKESNLVRDKILLADSDLSAAMDKARRDLGTEDCENARVLYRVLVEFIKECRNKEFPKPKIKNEDIEKVDQEITDLFALSKRKIDLIKKIKEYDNLVTRFLSQKDNNAGDNKQEWVSFCLLCNQQKDQLEECDSSGWSHPDVQYEREEIEDISNRFSHYIEMLELDKKIAEIRATMRSREQYEDFYRKCDEQALNIRKCRKNQWRIPALTIREPRELADLTRKKKRKAETMRKLTAFAVAVVVVCIAALIGFYQYKKDKIGAPIGASEARYENVDDIYRLFEQAGFGNIVTVEDEEGWLPDKQVVGIKAGSSSDFKKGTLINPNETIQISYSSEGRINAGDVLRGWREKDYETLKEDLIYAGLTDVKISDEITYEKESNNKADILLNGLQYSDGDCFVPQNAPVLITHYVLMIKIEKNNKKFEGKNYEKVMEELEEKGFENINCWGNGELVLGLLHKEGEVKTIKIDGSYGFSSSDEFLYDVPIEIEVYTR